MSDLARALVPHAVIQCLCWEPVSASGWHYNEGVSEKQEVISLMCSNLGLVTRTLWNRSIGEALEQTTWNMSVMCHWGRAGWSLESLHPCSLKSLGKGKRGMSSVAAASVRALREALRVHNSLADRSALLVH